MIKASPHPLPTNTTPHPNNNKGIVYYGFAQNTTELIEDGAGAFSRARVMVG